MSTSSSSTSWALIFFKKKKKKKKKEGVNQAAAPWSVHSHSHEEMPPFPPETPTLDDALALLRGRGTRYGGVHLDLKLTSPRERDPRPLRATRPPAGTFVSSFLPRDHPARSPKRDGDIRTRGNHDSPRSVLGVSDAARGASAARRLRLGAVRRTAAVRRACTRECDAVIHHTPSRRRVSARPTRGARPSSPGRSTVRRSCAHGCCRRRRGCDERSAHIHADVRVYTET